MVKLNTKDITIVTQVAFKGAIDLVAAGKMDVTDVSQLTEDFTKTLVDVIGNNVPETVATAGGGYDAGAAMADEFGATEVDSGGLRVLGEQHGPLPEWLISQAKAAGVTAVFDNRATKKGNQPWFKTPKDPKDGGPADKPFWPPRN